MYQHFLEIGQTNTLPSIYPWFLTTTMKLIMILVRVMGKWTLSNHFILTTNLHVRSLIGNMSLASHFDPRREDKKTETQINLSHLPQAPSKDRTEAAHSLVLTSHPLCNATRQRGPCVWSREERTGMLRGYVNDQGPHSCLSPPWVCH